MGDKSEDISPPPTNSQISSWAPPADRAEQHPQPADSLQPFSASFWSRDGHTASIRKTYLFTLASGTLLTAVAILAVLSIYWGALWKVGDGIHNINGWIVDFDGGAIGQVVQAVAINMTGPKNAITWSVMPSSNFKNGPADVVQAVLDEQCWVAVVVNPQASAKLNAAVSTVDSTHNSSSAVTVYAVEARNENAYPAFIASSPQVLMNVAAKVFADQHAIQLASNPNATTLLSRAPGVVTRPLYYTLDNLRPFDVLATSAADFVGLIYLLIISNLSFGARLQSGLARHLTLRSLIQVRILSPIAMYFFLSLIFALLSRAFQIPFDRVFHGGFAIFWVLCWVAMCAVGLALEAVVTLLTPRFTPYFMILWIIVNVSVCFYPIEVLPSVYKYGFGTPFYNVSRAVRTIVFNTRNQIGLNFGVEFAWIVLSLTTLPLFEWYKRRGDVHAWQGQHQAAKVN